MLAAADLYGDAARRGRAPRGIFIRQQVKTIVLLTAIGLADAYVSRGDEESARAIAVDSVRHHLGALQRFGAQALDRITSHGVERSHEHVTALSSGVSVLPGPKARAVELRPLDLGQIFERAIALYRRNCIALIAIAAASVVPVSIVQFLVLVREQPLLDATLNV